MDYRRNIFGSVRENRSVFSARSVLTGISLYDVERLTVMFSNLTYSVKVKDLTNKKAAPTAKIILHGISGYFKPGRLTAVMGMSGAGKTSLLDALAGNLLGGKIDGRVMVNGIDFGGKKIKDISGFVFQDDLLFDFMTVREAVEMSAILRLPDSMSMKEKMDRVNEIMEVLNLTKSQNTKVGSYFTKGLSGGERKRTAIAMELISNPPILFLDEPTTGLDAFTAFAVVKSLNRLAEQGRTVVATIHQPNSEVLSLFDDLCLMMEGRIIFLGSVNAAISYFEKLGFRFPKYANPIDYIFIEVIGLESQKRQNLEEESKSAIDLKEAWISSQNHRKIVDTIGRFPIIGVGSEIAKHSASFMTQFKFLYRRSLYTYIRDYSFFVISVISSIGTGVFLGLVYINSSSPDKTLIEQVRNQAGALYYLAMTATFTGIYQVLDRFHRESLIVFREYSSGYYGITPYYWSKVLVVVPIPLIFPLITLLVCYYMIGFKPAFSNLLMMGALLMSACFAGSGIGTWIGLFTRNLTLILFLQLIAYTILGLYSGLYTSSLPSWLSWIRYMSPIYYAFAGVMKLQFNGPIPDCVEPDSPFCDGNFVLDTYSLNNGLAVGVDLAINVAIGVFAFIAAYLTFLFRAWYYYRRL